MPAADYHAILAFPCTALGLRVDADALVAVDFLPRRTPPQAPRGALAREAARQLQAYLRDPAFRFEIPLAPGGTDFQRRVWGAISAIAAGATRSYSDLAADLRSAPRAVGGACRANPLPVVVPCHRVVARAGLGGFMGGTGEATLSIKRWLLAHEGA